MSLVCPKCDNPKSSVLNTRKKFLKKGNFNYIRRRRCCDLCFHRFTTIEILEVDFSKLKKIGALFKKIYPNIRSLESELRYNFLELIR